MSYNSRNKIITNKNIKNNNNILSKNIIKNKKNQIQNGQYKYKTSSKIKTKMMSNRKNVKRNLKKCI